MTLPSIYSVINFKNVTNLLGLDYANSSSISACCPFCSAYALSVYCDMGNQEEWIYCHQCKRSAGVIAMAADLLGMTEPDTLDFLVKNLNLQLTDAELRKLRNIPKRRDKYRAFWTSAQDNLLNPTKAQRAMLQQRGFELPTRMTAQELMDGPCHLFGLSTVAEIQKTGHGYMTSRTGRNIAVVPFYKNQSTITRFAVISGRGTFFPIHAHSADRVAKQNLKNNYTPRPSTDTPGLAGLPLLYQSNEDSVVVTSGLSVFIQMHLHNFRSNNVPLALLAWEQHRTKRDLNCWPVLGGRKIVLWDTTPTSALLQMAMSADCHVSFDCPMTSRSNEDKEANGWQKWICRMAGADAHSRVVASSQPYERALKRWLNRVSSVQAAKLIQDCEQSSEATSSLVRRLYKNPEVSRIGRRINVSNRHSYRTRRIPVIELNGKWYDCHHDVILPAILRVRKIVNRSRPGRSAAEDRLAPNTYAGYVEIDGKRHNYVLPVRTVLQNNTDVIKLLCSLGVAATTYQPALSEFNPSTAKIGLNYFQAAMIFQPPRLVQAKDCVGWDGSGFQLRRGRIADGRITKTESCLFHDLSGGPALNVMSKSQLEKPVWNFDAYASEAAMALLLAVCAQVTAPAAGLNCQPVIYRHFAGHHFAAGVLSDLGVLQPGTRQYVKTVNWPEQLGKDEHRVSVATNWYVLISRRTRKNQYEGITVNISTKKRTLCLSDVPVGLDVMLVRYLIEQSKPCNSLITSSWEEWLKYTGTTMKRVFGPAAAAMIARAESRLSLVEK